MSSPFFSELCDAIRRQVRANRLQGITRMSPDNLKQIVRPPSASLSGAPRGTNAEYAYAELFRDACGMVGVK